MGSPELCAKLNHAAQVIHWSADPEPPPFDKVPEGRLQVGVDLGTAYLTVVVLDEEQRPLSGEYTYAEVARDGLVVDFVGAVDLVKAMKDRIEHRISRELTHAASGYPPGIHPADVRPAANVVEASGMICTGLVDEPTAANALVRLQDGAIVDIGGGTTGIAVIKEGEVVYTADEATGGTHLSLVISGAYDIAYDEAERRKVTVEQQPSIFPVVRPVLEKMASIIARHIEEYEVSQLVLVGGTSAFYHAGDVIETYTGIPTWVSDYPALVTPLGFAMHDTPEGI